MNSLAGAFGKLPLPGSASGCFGNGVAYGRQRITARDRQEYVESRYMPTRSGRRPRKRADSPTGSGKPVTNDEVASSRDHVAKRALRHQYSKRPEPATATTSVTGQDIAQRVTWLKTSSRAVGEPGTGPSVVKERPPDPSIESLRHAIPSALDPSEIITGESALTLSNVARLIAFDSSGRNDRGTAPPPHGGAGSVRRPCTIDV
jgi:hypothetical protein